MEKKTIQKKWYKEFFQKYYYDTYHNFFTPARTKKDVNFIIRVLNLPKRSKILDLCGGYGRHSILLAKKGYAVTIQDLNKNFLTMAKKEAEKQKIKIKTVHSDMRLIPFKNEFDAVINIFTSFGYLENEKENIKVLKEVKKALKPGGKFLIDTINRNWILDNFQPKYWRKINNLLFLENRQVDFKTKRNKVKILIVDLKNSKIHSTYNEVRIYTFEELRIMLNKVGLKVIKKYGSLGFESYTKNAKRIVVLAEKRK